MDYIDVFNGDADGLCALIQLRHANPQPSQLITGVKRDINLLKHVKAQGGEHVTALDISFEKNAKDVQRLLDTGCKVDYFDHHKTGKLIQHPALHIDINLSADTCTSLIVDKYLQGRYRAWAITAAFGDNLEEVAYKLGVYSGFNAIELDRLKALGICLNYNGYGASISDLFFHPADLYKKLQLFKTPFEFMDADTVIFKTLSNGYQQDIDNAHQVIPAYSTKRIQVIILPNEAWARRVSGVFSNKLANQFPSRAHAILTEDQQGHYLVSIRAPLNRKVGADIVASQFPSGGGRKAAAGINILPKDQLMNFIQTFENQFM